MAEEEEKRLADEKTANLNPNIENAIRRMDALITIAKGNDVKTKYSKAFSKIKELFNNDEGNVVYPDNKKDEYEKFEKKFSGGSKKSKRNKKTLRLKKKKTLRKRR